MFNATIHNQPTSRQCKQIKAGKLNTITDIIDSLDISQSQKELDPNMYIKNMKKKTVETNKKRIQHLCDMQHCTIQFITKVIYKQWDEHLEEQRHPITVLEQN